MHTLRSLLIVLTLPWLIGSAAVSAADVPAHVAALAFLTGDWRGTLPDGRVAEEHFSTPSGGVLLSTGREFAGEKCVFFDLVVFSEEKGRILLTPHPFGRRSADQFPLVRFDAAASRAVFENLAHDFPKTFIYEIVSPDHLRIILTGEQKGQPVSETYDLFRVDQP